VEPPADEEFAWPVAGGEILSRYGAPRRGRRHAGLDIRGPKGQDILATRAGEVAYSGSALSGYGKMVVLDHGDGLQSVYAHASELLVKTGDRVDRGQPVARVGRTGNATTDHCHFEIRKNRVPVDPLPYFPEVAREARAAAPEVAEEKPRKAASAASSAKR
jgi:murein DD-endopeptidase MepM/ murein hydrolase activator NlpD